MLAPPGGGTSGTLLSAEGLSFLSCNTGLTVLSCRGRDGGTKELPDPRQLFDDEDGELAGFIAATFLFLIPGWH